MYETHHNAPEKPIYLTEEEAMALLDICLLSTAEDDPIKEKAVKRVSSVCREFLKAAHNECSFQPA